MAVPRPLLLQFQMEVVPCRSVSMDAWSPEQLKRMQLGGNDALNAFLKNYGVDKYTDIRDKYETQAAEVCSAQQSVSLQHMHVYSKPAIMTVLELQYYRDKIRAEIEGRTYVPPAPSLSNNSSARPPVASAGSRTSRAASSSNDTWDDWGAKPNSNVKVPLSFLFLGYRGIVHPPSSDEGAASAATRTLCSACHLTLPCQN